MNIIILQNDPCIVRLSHTEYVLYKSSTKLRGEGKREFIYFSTPKREREWHKNKGTPCALPEGLHVGRNKGGHLVLLNKENEICTDI